MGRGDTGTFVEAMATAARPRSSAPPVSSTGLQGISKHLKVLERAPIECRPSPRQAPNTVAREHGRRDWRGDVDICVEAMARSRMTPFQRTTGLEHCAARRRAERPKRSRARGLAQRAR